MAGPRIALVTSSRLDEVDPEMDPLLAACRQLGATAEATAWDRPIDWAAFDVAVIRSCWDYVDHVREFDGWLDRAEAATLLLNPAGLVRWNLHKRYLVELARRGVATVPTVVVERGEDPPALTGLFDATDEVVVKPAVSINAIGAARGRVDDPALADHLERLLSDGDALVQPFVPSVLTRGEASLVYIGGELSHAIRKVPTGGEYRVQEHHGGSVVAHAPSSEEVAVAGHAMAAAPVPPAYARVDLVETSDGPRLMELELIEPTLFLDHAPGAARRFAEMVGQEARRRPRAV